LVAPHGVRKVIFLTSEFPYPANGGGKLRDSHVLKLLQERADVEILCFGNPAQSTGQPRATIIERRKAPIWKRAIYPLRPYVVNGYCEDMAAAIRERAAPGTLLWVSRLAMAQYIQAARAAGFSVVLDEHNVESSVLMNAAFSKMRHWPSSLLAAQCRYYEERFCLASDAVVATSDVDAHRLQRLAPKAPIHIIPNSVDCEAYAEARTRPGRTLFFSGTLNYAPNVEGLVWFTAEVLPRLKAALGAEMPRVVVAGANPTPEILSRLGRAGVEVVPNPPSMLPYLADAAVVFVPIRSGSGTRLKILEAMASGRAVVSTGKGAEGLVLSPTYDVFVADQADTFTSAILRLLRNPQLRAEVGVHAVRTIEEHYDWRCARPLIEKLFASLAAYRTRAAGAPPSPLSAKAGE
jgi:glycosyltransferase involved in cell wall biosynthesis